MVASTAVRERGFAEAKRLCYAGLDAATLLRAVTERLRRVVPFDAYCAQTNDPLSGLLTNLLSDGAIIGEREHRTYIEHVYFEAELDQQRSMLQHRMPIALLSDVTGGQLERSLRFREITGPLGMGYELFTVCAVGGKQWGGICLIRERGHADFDAREAALLRGLAPHVAAGLQAAALLTRAATEPEPDGGPGVLVLDRRGRVVQHTAAAEHWLRELDDLGPSWLEGDGLPTPVWMVVGALRKALAPEATGDLPGTPRIRVRTRSGHWLTFHGAITESQGGQGGETIIMVGPSSPRELAWLRVSAYGLSERERAIVELVVQGASTKDVARTLHISEYTAQEHLSNIFDKVGVRGRRALVRRLFFDQLYPALSASTEDGR